MERYRAMSHPDAMPMLAAQETQSLWRRPNLDLDYEQALASDHNLVENSRSSQTLKGHGGSPYKFTPPGLKSTSHHHEAARKTLIKSKIQEIAKLCSDEGGDSQTANGQMERQILTILEESVAQQQNSGAHLSHHEQDRSTSFGPVRQMEDMARDRDYNKYKKSAIDDLKTERNNEDGFDGDFGFQSQGLLNQRSRPLLPESVNREVLQAIQSIERKAVEQIEALRQDKVSLMRKLNNEIRTNNQEKKNRLVLEAQIQRLIAILEKHGIDYKTGEKKGGSRKPSKSHKSPRKSKKKDRNTSKWNSPKGEGKGSPIREPFGPVYAQPINNQGQDHYYDQNGYPAPPQYNPQSQYPQIYPQPYPSYPYSSQPYPSHPSNQQLGAGIRPESPIGRRDAQFQNEHEQQELARQIGSLEKENHFLKSRISVAQPGYAAAPGTNKASLMSELSRLKSMLKDYQSQITVLQERDRAVPEIERLYREGEIIRQEGSQLARRRGSLGSDYVSSGLNGYRGNQENWKPESVPYGGSRVRYSGPSQYGVSSKRIIEPRQYGTYGPSSSKRIDEFESVLSDIKRANM